MCITKEVSLSVFIICTISCIYLYKRNLLNDRWIAILFAYVGIIQLLEYFIWKDQECAGLNQKATQITFYVVFLQPIISLLVAYIMTNGKIPMWLYILNIIYIIYALPFIYKKLKTNQCTKPCDGSKIGLSWPWLGENNIGAFIFFLALVSPFLLMKNNGTKYFILNTVMWLLSGMIGSYRCQGIVDIPSGSLWCLMAFIFPLYKIVFP